MSLDYCLRVDGLSEQACVEMLLARSGMRLIRAEAGEHVCWLDGCGLRIAVDGKPETGGELDMRLGVEPELALLITQAKNVDAEPPHLLIANIVGELLRAASGNVVFFFTQGDRVDLWRKEGIVLLDDDADGFWRWCPATLDELGLDFSFGRTPRL